MFTNIQLAKASRMAEPSIRVDGTTKRAKEMDTGETMIEFIKGINLIQGTMINFIWKESLHQRGYARAEY